MVTHDQDPLPSSAGCVFFEFQIPATPPEVCFEPAIGAVATADRNPLFSEEPQQGEASVSKPSTGTETTANFSSEGLTEEEAAVIIQKFYRSHRTRRQLADLAVMNKNYAWWNVLEGVLLQQRSEAFYAYKNQDTAASRWTRLQKKAAKVGKGLSQDANARKLAIQHWLEAIDPRHRYGHNLHYYYTSWENSSTKEPFFYWLDIGEGKDVELPYCKRSKLLKQMIKYLGPKEREEYEVVVEGGKLRYRESRKLVHTPKGDKWIFVMSADGRLYIAQKQKGTFQHSSFLAGGAAKAAGRLLVNHGTLELMEAHSGHYRPTQENFSCLMKVLQDLGTDLSTAKVQSVSDDMLQKYPSGKVSTNTEELCIEELILEGASAPKEVFACKELEGVEQVSNLMEETRDGNDASEAIPHEEEPDATMYGFQVRVLERRMEHKMENPVLDVLKRQALWGGLKREEADIARLVLVPPENSEGVLNWSSEAGPRIASLAGCPM